MPKYFINRHFKDVVVNAILDSILQKVTRIAMFNFSANNQMLISTKQYEKCYIHVMKDMDTKRYYKVYDFSKSIVLEIGKTYSIFGKVNSADKIYLVLEKCKEKICSA
jgi:hypothetical protein